MIITNFCVCNLFPLNNLQESIKTSFGMKLAETIQQTFNIKYKTYYIQGKKNLISVSYLMNLFFVVLFFLFPKKLIDQSLDWYRYGYTIRLFNFFGNS